ncbi:MAG: hypothetical protein KGI54_17040 [Pseudomonadota bacterium]|nr:hypothetical protein [Pseudomonadota bacterium]
MKNLSIPFLDAAGFLLPAAIVIGALALLHYHNNNRKPELMNTADYCLPATFLSNQIIAENHLQKSDCVAFSDVRRLSSIDYAWVLIVKKQDSGTIRHLTVFK